MSGPKSARSLGVPAGDLAALTSETGLGRPPRCRALEEHAEGCLSCLAFPESSRWRIRTTHGLVEQRLNQEIKHRMRGGVRLFPNREACYYVW